MGSIIEIVSDITNFMTFFVPGFIFLRFFYFVGCIQRETDERYLIIESIALSYVLSSLLSCIFSMYNISDQYFYIVSSLEAACFGIICGMMHRSDWCNSMSNLLFHREFERNVFLKIWEELERRSKSEGNLLLFAKIMTKNESVVYIGQVTRIFSCYSNPVIQMEYYSVFDKNGTQLEDNTNEDDIVALFNYSDILHFDYLIHNVSKMNTL